MMTCQLLVLMLLASCQEAGTTAYDIRDSQTPGVESSKINVQIIVKTISFSRTTFMNVSCNDFDHQFQDARTTKIMGVDDIRMIKHRMLLFKKEKHPFPMNARAKVVVLSDNGKRDTICISKFSMTLNGEFVQYDRTLIKLLHINAE